MNVKLRLITKSDFERLNVSKLFENELGDLGFGIISNGECQYKLSWQSDLIEPEITMISDKIYAIGIDLNYVVLDCSDCRVILNLALNTLFCTTEIFNNVVYVVTQIEIFRFYTWDLTSISSVALPDVFSDIEFKNDNAIVTCMNGRIVIANFK